jgi:hypothetical protein
MKTICELIKFDGKVAEFEVDNDIVTVHKDERSRLIVKCTCKDCSYYNIKKRNILCRRQLAVYKWLFEHNGYVRENDISKITELDLP